VLGEKVKGRDWYGNRFLRMVGPAVLYGLPFTIVILFALQGGQAISRPPEVARIALPLPAYFTIMWTGSFAIGKAVGLNYERTTTLAFTAAGNNFELATPSAAHHHRWWRLSASRIVSSRVQREDPRRHTHLVLSGRSEGVLVATILSRDRHS
jgi:hypothetical protein